MRTERSNEIGDGLVDRGEELLELHGPVTSVKLGDHRAVGDVERRDSPKDYVQGGTPRLVTPLRT